MGYVLHHAIVATCWQDGAAEKLRDHAESVGAEALVGKEQTNGYRTVCITPDGSKEGWDASEEGNKQRRQIVEWLRTNADETYFEWCEVKYGDDDGRADVSDDAWWSTHD